jgi:hypothetical protein
MQRLPLDDFLKLTFAEPLRIAWHAWASHPFFGFSDKRLKHDAALQATGKWHRDTFGGQGGGRVCGGTEDSRVCDAPSTSALT